MNKDELVAEVVERTGTTKTMAKNCIDAVFDAVAGAIAKGDEVRVPGFGVFSGPTREAHEGRNPRTGETVKIAAMRVPKFKASKTLKDQLSP